MSSPSVDERRRYLAANIRRLREKLGWTQTDLAKKIGVELRYVQTLESGEANPTVATMLRVGDGLGVGPGELFRKTQLVRRPAGRPRKER